MIGQWLVSAFIRFETNGVATMERLSASTKAFNDRLAYQQGLIDKNELALRRYNARLAEMRVAQQRAGTMFAGGAAIAGGALIGYGVDQAGKFQLAMTAVRLSLNANAQQTQMLQRTATRVSGVTAQSATTIAQEMDVASTTGLNTLGVARFNRLFPLLAKFADVQYFMAKSKGQEMAPTQAISYGVQFAHMFQAFTPGKMQSMLEWITKLTMVTGDPQKALTQAKYFVPLGTSLGLKMSDLFPLMAIMGQTGFLSGRGGTSIKNMLLGAINSPTLTGHAQAKQRGALEDLGILDSHGRNVVVTSRGTLDWNKLTTVLAAAAARLKPTTYAQDVKGAFSMSAAPFATVLNTPAVQEQVGRTRRMMEGLGNDPIGKFFDQMMNNVGPQFMRFMTNLTNVAINTFLPVLPEITTMFKVMADNLGRFGDWLGANPGIAANIAHILMALTGFAALRFVAGSVYLAATAFGLLAGVTPGLSFFSRALIVLDNFAFLGLGQKLIGLARNIGLLDVAGTVAGKVGAAATALGQLANVSLPWWLKGLLPGGAAMLAGGLINRGQQKFDNDSRWLYQQNVLKYGKPYADYLQSHGANPNAPGGIEKDSLYKNQIVPSRPLSPQDYKTLHPGKTEVHLHGNVSIVLPKDSDQNNAQRLLQFFLGTAGAAHPGTRMNITPAAYGAATPVG